MLVLKEATLSTGTGRALTVHLLCWCWQQRNIVSFIA